MSKRQTLIQAAERVLRMLEEGFDAPDTYMDGGEAWRKACDRFKNSGEALLLRTALKTAKPKAKYVVEGEWSGYTSSQRRVCHRRVVADPEPFRQIHAIQYSDNTTLAITVRELRTGERVEMLGNYTDLIDRAVSRGLSGCISVDQLSPTVPA